MLKYPNGQKHVIINEANKKKTNYTNRGMHFEDEINRSNDYYRDDDRAVIYKKPTPIKVTKASKNSLGTYVINEAYYQMPSTTDYNGIYRGKYIDFEAKETRNKNLFALSNIHDHQLKHLFSVVKHGGIAFILVHFVMHNEVYLMDATILKEEIDSGSKSIKYEVFKEKGILVPYGYQIPIDYLKVVDSYYFK